MAEVLGRARLGGDDSTAPSSPAVRPLPLEAGGGPEAAEELGGHTVLLWLVLLCTNKLEERTKVRKTSSPSNRKRINNLYGFAHIQYTATLLKQNIYIFPIEL